MAIYLHFLLGALLIGVGISVFGLISMRKRKSLSIGWGGFNMIALSVILTVCGI